MTTDPDIQRAVDQLIQQHGEDALLHAATWAKAIAREGDLDTYVVWQRLVKAVNKQLAKEQSRDESPVQHHRIADGDDQQDGDQDVEYEGKHHR